MHIYPCSFFVNAAGNEYWQEWESVLYPTTQSTLWIWHLKASPLFAASEPNVCRLVLFPPLHFLLSLMHLYAALKGCALMMGDHSIYRRCSCKYSNEPSSVDGVRDNGSIFYLPLLVCDSRIYLVDCIIVPKSAWFASINFSRHTSFPAPAEANAYSFTRLSFQ